MRLAPLLALLIALPAPALAYVRAVTPRAGIPWQWHRADLVLDVNTGGAGPELPADELVQAVAAAAAPWSQPALTCTSVRLGVVSHPEAEGPAKRDEANRVVFRRQQWCPDPRAPDEDCYAPEILALTTSHVSPAGQIVEADIEVNAVDHAWTDLVRRSGALPGASDLQNTLTHEIGHLLGFAHSCLLSPKEPSRTDDGGQPVPLCWEAGPQARESTMTASIAPSDTDRRTLTEDDERGVCEVYPKGITRGLNQGQPPAGGCAVSGRGSPSLLGLVPLLGLVLGPRWRRRQRARAWLRRPG